MPGTVINALCVLRPLGRLVLGAQSTGYLLAFSPSQGPCGGGMAWNGLQPGQGQGGVDCVWLDLADINVLLT